MVDAEKGAPLLQRVRAVRARWASSSAVKTYGNEAQRRSAFRALAAQGKAPWEGWWQPARPPAPVLEKTALQMKEAKREQKAQEKSAAAASPPKAGKWTQAGTPPAQPHSPASQPPRPSPAPAPPRRPAGKRSFFQGRPWGALALQLLIATMLSISIRSGVPLLVTIALCINSLIDFSAHWGRFVLTMGVLFLLSTLLR